LRRTAFTLKEKLGFRTAAELIRFAVNWVALQSGDNPETPQEPKEVGAPGGNRLIDFGEPKAHPDRMTLDDALLRRMPKVLLHEHLDGGLRPQTVIDLAAEVATTVLPTTNAKELGVWFHRGANKGSLPEYLEGFAHTCGVMQTRAAIERVAFEFIEDMHQDGVVYAEVRFAPCFHLERGLTPEAVYAGGDRWPHPGEEKVRRALGADHLRMRHRTDSLEWAELAIDFRERGVVGFDLAGEEAGYPPKKHAEAFQAIQRGKFYSTLHAGEAFGVASIWQALQICGAHRLAMPRG
jgi:adenosine deaminase